MYDVDAIGLQARELLRERTGALIAEACAWSVGLSDRPHCVRRHGRVVETGLTMGLRAETGQRLSGEEDARLELGDPGAGTFADALNALTPDGRQYADRFDEAVLAPFVLETCVLAVERVRRDDPPTWGELLDELGEDESSDPAEVVRAAEWEAPLRIDASVLVLSALGEAPLVEVEAEGLPLSLVRAAEAETRAAAPVLATDPPPRDAELSGALFLAETAVHDAGLAVPVPVEQAEALLKALRAEGLEPDEVVAVLPQLPVRQETVEEVGVLLEAELD